jgi:hypothetical protein
MTCSLKIAISIPLSNSITTPIVGVLYCGVTVASKRIHYEDKEKKKYSYVVVPVCHSTS